MLAYEYLKSKARDVGPLINDNWTELFKDAPLATKMELIEVQKLTPNITDSILFFHSIATCHKLYNGTAVSWPFDIWEHTNFLDTMYSIIQKNPEYNEFIVVMLLPKVEAWMHKLWITFEEWLNVVKNMKDNLLLRIDQAILCALNPSFNLQNVFQLRGAIARQGFAWMSEAFMRRCTIEQLNEAYDLWRDKPSPERIICYSSLSALKRDHDAAAEAQVEKEMAHFDGKVFKYDQRLIDVVHRFGFTLPASRKDMALRGKRHHNCVGTYGDAQCDKNPHKLNVRVIFAPDATAELQIELAHDKIVAVYLKQYKGAYNHDMDIPERMTDLRVCLTGLSWEIIKVTEVDDGEGQNDCAL